MAKAAPITLDDLRGILAADIAEITGVRSGPATWRELARPEQLPPTGDWRTWLILAGRGWGKTRTGSESLLAAVRAGATRLAVIAPTAADARDVCAEGPAGIVTCALPGEVTQYNRSLGEIVFATGARCKLFSADSPDRLRGPQHEYIWGDEPGAWLNTQTVYDMASFGLRLGSNPRMVLTTTPRMGNAWLRGLQAAPGVVVTRGRTRDNADNLAPGIVDELEARYGGTRLGRQELEGEVLADVPGALWQYEWLQADGFRLPPAIGQRGGTATYVPPVPMSRVMVAIDPSVSDPERRNDPGKDLDACGIVVAGVGEDGRAYVLGDYTAVLAPQDWARLAVRLYELCRANRIIAEANQGGELIREVLRNVASNVPITLVHASQGKRPRAEPVALLYEQGRVSHCGELRELEDQLCTWDAFNPGARSPNNIDALVWAFHGLGLTLATGNRSFDRIRTIPQND